MKRRYLTYNGDYKQYAKLVEDYEEKLKNWQEKYKTELAEIEKHESTTGVCFMDMAMFLEKPFPPSRVEIVPEGYALHVYGNYSTYPVEKITTKKDLLAWLRCVSGKNWFDGEMCEDFINAVCDQNHWELPFYYD